MSPTLRVLALLAALPLLHACALLGLDDWSETTTVEPVVAGPATFFQGASVMTAAGPTLASADVLVVGSKIAAVGPGLEVPEGAVVVDASGRWITPGLIDVHSHMGVYAVPSVRANADGNESTGPFKPEVRAIDSFWPQDPALRRAVAGGVTTIHVLPGSANLVGGQGATLRMTPQLSADEMRFEGAPTTMKMACGENPKRVYGKRKKTAPGTRMGEVAMLRQRLEKDKSYAPKGSVDFGRQAMRKVVDGEITIQNHCYRADEMLLRLALFDEFGITPRAFHHAIEAYKIRAQLAEAGVGAAVWVDWWGNKMEMLDTVQANAALLDEVGVRVAVHSDSPYDVQRLNQQAAKALAAGQRAGVRVDRDRAIRWVTANPAWVLGIEDRTGTLEPGRDADLVVWSGDPFSVYSRADLVLIEGQRVYDREHPEVYPVSDFDLGIGVAP
jgi:imidazolonepropionase-like amidohydrolase